ncbi:MAG: nucleotidyltransferase domain-containing protein [Planctomycetota bacterium]
MGGPVPSLTLTPAEHLAVSEFVAATRVLLGDDLHEIRLFGSRARGEGTADSDLDLTVIVTPTGRSRRYEVSDCAYDIGLRHSVLLAPTVITRERLDELRARERRFAADLDREGIPL